MIRKKPEFSSSGHGIMGKRPRSKHLHNSRKRTKHESASGDAETSAPLVDAETLAEENEKNELQMQRDR